MKSVRLILIIALAALSPRMAQASILDDDPNGCKKCVAIANSYQTVYYSLDGLPPGQQATFYLSAPTPNVPDIPPVLTGTTTLIVTPGPTQGTMIGIVNQTSGGVLTDNGNGYLDAADSLTAFGLQASTDVQLSGTTIQHSFYVASDEEFDIYARITVTRVGAFGTNVNLQDIGYQIAARASGTDGSFSYGGNSTIGNSTSDGFVPVAGITNLSQILTTPVRVAQFIKINGNDSKGAKTNKDNNPQPIATQFIRVTASYTPPPYDLSQGDGTLDLRIEYLIYKP